MIPENHRYIQPAHAYIMQVSSRRVARENQPESLNIYGNDWDRFLWEKSFLSQLHAGFRQLPLESRSFSIQRCNTASNGHPTAESRGASN